MLTNLFVILLLTSVPVLVAIFVLSFNEKNPAKLSLYRYSIIRIILGIPLIGVCFSLYLWNQTVLDYQLIQVIKRLDDIHIRMVLTDKVLTYSIVALSIFFISFMIGRSRS
ncbi:hypothetical protein OM416_19925 [Paenibacillus sp. LS1]|uniref:hypothetical protein n=1 Tax=Paenibacillus sp. LS1 TaxID=2992120 RepID=UPI0022321E3D|nr:hypothetical protein [Paenibacillus sp. LS1]MCW3793865.1 hypothetical protein [Paenibacillus sp. LS1]